MLVIKQLNSRWHDKKYLIGADNNTVQNQSISGVMGMLFCIMQMLSYVYYMNKENWISILLDKPKLDDAIKIVGIELWTDCTEEKMTQFLNYWYGGSIQH